MKKFITAAVAVGAIAAVPAYAGAHGGKPQSPGQSGTHGPSGTHGKSNTKSKRCKKAHSVGFVVGGVLQSSAIAQDSGSNTYSGTISLTVKHTNHHAKGFDGSNVVLDHVVVTFGDGVTGPNPPSGTNVHLIGKLPRFNHKCSTPNGTPRFRKVNFTSGSNVSGGNVSGSNVND